MALSLVTGGAGFIGSHLVEALLRRGDSVRVLDDFSTGKRENLEKLSGYVHRDRLEVREGDIRDATQVEEAVQGVEVIFHKAAYVSSPKSLDEPAACFDINVRGTEILLEAARQTGVRRVVLASSAAIYGDSEALPLTEDTPLRPLTPYAISKQVNEIYAGFYNRAYALEVTALRYFNVFGPKQPPDSEYAAAVPIFISQFIASQPVTIYGDGSQTRDLIYVADVVRVNLIAAEHPEAAGQIFNVCTGQETRMIDLVTVLQSLFPAALPPVFTSPRAGDICRSVGSPERAARLLGFSAQTSLADGLKETVAWMKKSN